MSVSPDTTAAVYADQCDREQADPERFIAAAIRADRQQFAPLIQKVRRAIAEQQMLPLMVAAQKLTEAIEEGMSA